MEVNQEKECVYCKIIKDRAEFAPSRFVQKLAKCRVCVRNKV